MSTLPASAPLPADDEHGHKRRQILKGARAVFLELGFDGASMGEIAKAAGVSKGTLYVYFADKSSLFTAIVEQEIIEQGTAVVRLRRRQRRRDTAARVRQGLYSDCCARRAAVRRSAP